MIFRHTEQNKSEYSPGIALILLLVYFFIGLFVAQFLAVLVCMLLFGTGFTETLVVAENLQHPDARYILFTLQFFSAVGGFLIGPWFYLKNHDTRRFTDFFNKRGRAIIPLSLAAVITLSFMVVNSMLIEWNANLLLPESLKTLESWAQEKELYLQKLTDYLTTFTSTADFLLAFFIIAVIPAVGEELFFRGLLQPLLGKKIGNMHVAIWLTALIFSAFHFQFYGLVPRLFLGAVFGYLYFWSGNLWMPVLGHFINNGLSLLMLFLFQQGVTDFDASTSDALPGTMVSLFLVLGIVAAFGYRRWFLKQAIQT